MHGIIRFLIMLLAGASGGLAFLVLRKIRMQGKHVHTAYIMSANAVAPKFKLLQTGAYVMLIGFLAIAVGGVTGGHHWTTIGELSIMLFFVTPVITMYKLWDRLQ